MSWRNAISLHRISLPHSLNALGHRLKSNSRAEPLPLRLTKVAPRLTALQGVDYCSMASTVKPRDQERDRHCTVCHTSVDTLYVVITARVPLHM